MPLPVLSHVFRAVDNPEIKKLLQTDGKVVYLAKIRGGASNRRFNEATGEWETKGRMFIDVDYFGDDATIVAGRISKGDEFLASGELKTESWENSAGEKRSKISLRARRIAPIVELPRFNGEAAGSSNLTVSSQPTTVTDNDEPPF